MRSIQIFLKYATKNDVSHHFLNMRFPGQNDHWNMLVDNNPEDPYLYVYLQDWSDLTSKFGFEYEENEIAEIINGLGDEPSVVLNVDVSGRHPGDEQLNKLVTDILWIFEGVAMDEYTQHIWTLDEILEHHMENGHPFFDYRGWYEERHLYDTKI